MHPINPSESDPDASIFQAFVDSSAWKYCVILRMPTVPYTVLVPCFLQCCRVLCAILTPIKCLEICLILVPYGSSSEHGIKKNALDSQLAEFSMGILFLQEGPFRYKIDSLSDNLPSQEGQHGRHSGLSNFYCDCTEP